MHGEAWSKGGNGTAVCDRTFGRSIFAPGFEDPGFQGARFEGPAFGFPSFGAPAVGAPFLERGFGV